MSFNPIEYVVRRFQETGEHFDVRAFEAVR